MLHEGNSLFKTDALNEFSATNMRFTNIKSKSNEDILPEIFDISALDVSKDTDLEIRNVTISDSDVRFVEFSRISNFENSSNSLIISDFIYTNSLISAETSLLSFVNMIADTDFSINMNRISFLNIEFATKGSLLVFKQQLSNKLTITDLDISNTRNAIIESIASSIQNSQLPCRVSISNLTTTNVFTGFSSLMNVYENTEFEIRDSELTGIYSFEGAAVLYAGYQNALVSIYNTQIKYNSGIDSAVFTVDSSSIIRLYDCNLFSNFGLTAGIVKAENNGQFQFHRCNFTENSSNSYPIAQLFDVPIAPVLDHCIIHTHLRYSKSQILSLMQEPFNCGLICFFNEEYKQYLKDNQNLMLASSQGFLIQLISSSIEILNGTVVYDEYYFLDAFVSTVTMRDIIISD